MVNKDVDLSLKTIDFGSSSVKPYVVNKNDDLFINIWAILECYKVVLIVFWTLFLDLFGSCSFVLFFAIPCKLLDMFYDFIARFSFSHSLTSFAIQDGFSCRTRSILRKAVEISNQQTRFA